MNNEKLIRGGQVITMTGGLCSCSVDVAQTLLARDYKDMQIVAYETKPNAVCIDMGGVKANAYATKNYPQPYAQLITESQ